MPCTWESALARQPVPATAIVSRTSCRSGGSDSIRSAIASCTLSDIAMSVVSPAVGPASHSPDAASVVSQPWAKSVLRSSIT
jgi:hypothetical protein